MSSDEDTEMLDPPPPLIEYDPLLNEAASVPLSFASPSPFTQYMYPTTPLVSSESESLSFPDAYYPNYPFYNSPAPHPNYTPLPSSTPITPVTESQKPSSRIHTTSSTGFDGDGEITDSRVRKLENILIAIKQEDWSVADFLYHFFRVEDIDRAEIVHRTRRHAATLSNFLQGRTKYTPATIIKELVNHPMGRPKPGHAEYNDMFSTAKPFESIKFAHPAVTSFAAQLVEEHLVKNATLLASLEGGLHTWNPDTGREIKTETFGAETLQAATVALQEGNPLLWRYCVQVATPKHRDRLSRAKNASLDQRAAARNHCPPEIVAAHAISSLIFSRNRNANLLPTDKGMLLFSCDANRYLFAHESRIGASVSYHAVLDALDHFAQADGESVLAMAWDEDGSGIVRFDNLQKQVHARYERVGWEARMMIGCAGTFCKAEGFKKEAVSLQKKREWLAKNLRATLTFNQLWDLIDHDYLSNVLPLLWLQILIDILSTVIPEASRTYHSELEKLASFH